VSRDRHADAPPPPASALDGARLRSIANELDPGPPRNHHELASHAIRATLGRDPGAGPDKLLKAVRDEVADHEARRLASDAARSLSRG